MKALFCTTVWGEEYIDRFLNYSLRTQLSEGNLPGIGSDSLYLISTFARDIDRFNASPYFQALKRVISVEFVAIETVDTGSETDKYSTLAACQNHALRRSTDFDVIFFGYADAIWAQGSYRAALKKIEEGYDVVFSVGYPVLDTPIKALIDAILSKPNQCAAPILPRKLAKAIYQNLHPMARANNWHSQWLTHCPSYLIWDVSRQGLLVRAFHLHPVAVKVINDPLFFRPFQLTLDEEFVGRLARLNPRIYVCPTSDEICVCGISEQTDSTYIMEPPRAPHVGDVANFAERYAGLLHREMFGYSTRLIIGKQDEHIWAIAEAEAANLANAIQIRLSAPDSVLELEQPAGFSARLERRLIYKHWLNERASRPRYQSQGPLGKLLSASFVFGWQLVTRVVVYIFRILYRLKALRAVRFLVLPYFSDRVNRRAESLFIRLRAKQRALFIGAASKNTPSDKFHLNKSTATSKLRVVFRKWGRRLFGIGQ